MKRLFLISLSLLLFWGCLTSQAAPIKLKVEKTETTSQSVNNNEEKDTFDHITVLKEMDEDSMIYNTQQLNEAKAEFRKNSHILYAILAVLVACILFVVYNIYKERAKRKHLERKFQELKLAPKSEDKLIQAKAELNKSDIIVKLRRMVENPVKNGSPDASDWQALDMVIDKTYPEFSTQLLTFSEPKELEYRVCLLIKAGFTPSEISILVNRSKQALTNLRARLYKKTFGKDEGAKAWDEFIASI